MSKNIKRYITFILLIATIIFALLYFTFSNEETLPIYNPSDFNQELVDISLQNKAKGHTVADFELINQNGKTITQSHYENKIYVTDFFFTNCPSICPIMSSNMEKLQETFLKDKAIMLLSMSVTPELDSIPVLRKYADKHGALDGKWNITTGEKKHIYNLARKSYFAVVDKGDGGLQDFIHTPNFILVDTEKKIRGVYDGTKDQEIERLIDDIKVLMKRS